MENQDVENQDATELPKKAASKYGSFEEQNMENSIEAVNSGEMNRIFVSLSGLRHFDALMKMP